MPQFCEILSIDVKVRLMSNVTELLMQKSAQYRKQAEELAQANADVYSALDAAGVDMVKAASMMVNNELQMEFTEADYLSTLFEKMAGYIGELETQVETLQSGIDEAVQQVEHVEKKAEFSDEINTLHQAGFSEEEIDRMMSASPSTIEKVASLASQPYSLGEPIGPAVGQLDPMLAFVMG